MRFGAWIAGLAALVVAGSIAQAQPFNDCHERIRQAEIQLDRIVERFGSASRQAWDARQELLRLRDMCYRTRDGSGQRDRRPPH